MDLDVSIWTRERVGLRGSLAQVDSLIGELYGRAIDALDEEPTCSALIVASHCIREITNNLIDILGDVDDLPMWQDNSSYMQLLATLWDRHEITFEPEDCRPDDPTSDQIGSSVSIPTEVAAAIEILVQAHRAARTNSLQRRSALVAGTLNDGEHPSVRIVDKSLRFFMKYTHLRKSAEFPLPERKLVLENLAFIEDSLIGRIGSFFDRLDDIEELLAIANQRINDPGSIQ